MNWIDFKAQGPEAGLDPNRQFLVKIRINSNGYYYDVVTIDRMRDGEPQIVEWCEISPRTNTDPFGDWMCRFLKENPDMARINFGNAAWDAGVQHAVDRLVSPPKPDPFEERFPDATWDFAVKKSARIGWDAAIKYAKENP